MRIQTRRQQIQELQAENRRLVKTQELIVDNILSIQSNEAIYSGNRYKTYDTAVTELALKYVGQADWGVIQAGSIVDLRAAYIIGQGIKVSKIEADDGDATPEYDFAQRFIEKNELDHELPQDLAKEGEIEGRALIKLFPVKSDAADAIGGVDIVLRWVSWTSNHYTVKVSKDDYLQLESVEWNPAGGAAVKLAPEECVYKRFAGRLDIPGDTMPRAAKCLTQIENLDMALRDWRKINSLYAAPVPDFECKDAEQAKKTNEALDKINWKIGKAFAHTGVFSYKQPSSEGQKAIEMEILTLMKLISGTTGVPINALGAPELTTKLGADSQAQLDLIAMSTSKEREIWKAAFQEMLTKAMRMWNAATQKTPLRPEFIKVDLPVVTAEQWDRIASTWLLLFNSQAITRKTMLSQVPGLDAEAEIKALAEEDAGALDKFTNQPPDPNADPDKESTGGQGNLKNLGNPAKGKGA
jgi:hypothetical protein